MVGYTEFIIYAGIAAPFLLLAGKLLPGGRAKKRGALGSFEIEELPEVLVQEAMPGREHFLVEIVRQSGGADRAYQISDRDAVLFLMAKQFRSMRVTHVKVRRNDEWQCFVTRPFHSHRGRSEGKVKLGVRVKVKAGPALAQ